MCSAVIRRDVASGRGFSAPNRFIVGGHNSNKRPCATLGGLRSESVTILPDICRPPWENVTERREGEMNEKGQNRTYCGKSWIAFPNTEVGSSLLPTTFSNFDCRIVSDG
jgi:hypothetical protein